jgi:hypothetical protein
MLRSCSIRQLLIRQNPPFSLGCRPKVCCRRSRGSSTRFSGDRDSDTQVRARTRWRINRAPDPSTNSHRKLIAELAARYRLSAIYSLRAATIEGGLMSYGGDIPDLFRQAAVYADPGAATARLPPRARRWRRCAAGATPKVPAFGCGSSWPPGRATQVFTRCDPA